MHIPWLTDYIQFLRFEKRYSTNTLTAYKKDIEQFLSFIEGSFDISNVTEVTHFHVRSWLSEFKESGMSARTLNRKLSSLNSFFKYLLKFKRVSKNPIDLLHSQKLPERLPQYLKEQETGYLLEEISFGEGFKGFTDRMICTILYQTGMRRAEILNLKEKDIEWSLKQVRVWGKGNKERLVPLHDNLLSDLKLYIKDKKELNINADEALLVLDNGKPLYAGYIYRTVNYYLKQVTTISKKSPHTFRHTFATHLLNNGANIQAIKELLGHSSLAATQVYTHNNIDKLKEIHKTAHPRG